MTIHIFLAYCGWCYGYFQQPREFQEQRRASCKESETNKLIPHCVKYKEVYQLLLCVRVDPAVGGGGVLGSAITNKVKLVWGTPHRVKFFKSGLGNIRQMMKVWK